MQNNWTLTVSQLNEYVRVQLASDPILSELCVEGEISGFKRAVSGHMYFSLKDENARVQCVMFRQHALSLGFVPEDGMKVTVRGSASLFVRDGAYQVYVESMQQQGLGDLYRQFIFLKESLTREGLFDPSLKRELPEMPRCIGIVTSRSGAVLHDILRVGWSRWPNMRFVLAPCSVQGAQAADEIVSAIELLNAYSACDVILCGRGGGSLEELWPFNEEKVARAIRASHIPVVSCVGHETDFTIADFAADYRAATPSNAAEIAIPLQKDYIEELHAYREEMHACMRSRVSQLHREIEFLTDRPIFKDPAAAWVGPRRNELQQLAHRLNAAAEKALRMAKGEYAVEQARLNALRPGAPLERGYALIEQDDEMAESAFKLHSGRISVWMKDGGWKAELTERIEGSAWEHAEKKGTDI